MIFFAFSSAGVCFVGSITKQQGYPGPERASESRPERASESRPESARASRKLPKATLFQQHGQGGALLGGLVGASSPLRIQSLDP